MVSERGLDLPIGPTLHYRRRKGVDGDRPAEQIVGPERGKLVSQRD
jgi:hypothetical protein